MHIAEFLTAIEKEFPPATGWAGDRIGLQVQSGRAHVMRVLVAYEIDEDVIDFAVENQSDCIVAFHPLIFSPLPALLDTDRIGRKVQRLIKANIAVVIIHTNFDAFPRGTSALLAERLGLSNIKPLIPDSTLPDHGMGVIAESRDTISTELLLERLHVVCRSPIRYTKHSSSQISRIAIVAGSGSDYFQAALSLGADCFITSDCKYHLFHEAKHSMTLIDPGHAEMERFVPNGLTEELNRLFSKEISSGMLETILHYQNETNPIQYFVPNTSSIPGDLIGRHESTSLTV